MWQQGCNLLRFTCMCLMVLSIPGVSRGALQDGKLLATMLMNGPLLSHKKTSPSGGWRV